MPPPPPIPPRLPAQPPVPPPASPPPPPTRLATVTPWRATNRPGPILSPGELDRFKDLLVFARSTVEGYFTGKHKSPYRGSSAEFADYKEYVAGDDLTHLDWRA